MASRSKSAVKTRWSLYGLLSSFLCAKLIFVRFNFCFFGCAIGFFIFGPKKHVCPPPFFPFFCNLKGSLHYTVKNDISHLCVAYTFASVKAMGRGKGCFCTFGLLTAPKTFSLATDLQQLCALLTHQLRPTGKSIKNISK